MELGICSYSFHRLLAAGKQDVFRYINDCKELGCTQLDPWNAHLSDLKKGDDALRAGDNPHLSHQLLSPADEDYLEAIEEAADASGLPWGTLAVDGAILMSRRKRPGERTGQRRIGGWISRESWGSSRCGSTRAGRRRCRGKFLG